MQNSPAGLITLVKKTKGMLCTKFITRAQNLFVIVHYEILFPIITKLLSDARVLLVVVEDFSPSVLLCKLYVNPLYSKNASKSRAKLRHSVKD